MKEISRMAGDTDMALIHGLMVTNIRESGSRVSVMDGECFSGVVETNTKENS